MTEYPLCQAERDRLHQLHRDNIASVLQMQIATDLVKRIQAKLDTLHRPDAFFGHKLKEEADKLVAEALTEWREAYVAYPVLQDARFSAYVGFEPPLGVVGFEISDTLIDFYFGRSKIQLS